MRRLFTFGCSFTGYWYPTWADILIAEARDKGMDGFNYGRAGAGNVYISMRVWEAHAKYKFTSDDCIIICWSGFNREDRYTQKLGWVTPGNMGSQHSYQDWFIEHWHDIRFCAMRDCAVISSTQLALKQLGVNMLNWSMAPLIQHDQYKLFQTFPEQIDVVNTYDLKFDAIPMTEDLSVIFENSEYAKTRLKIIYPGFKDAIPELHPTPAEHLNYLENNIIDKITWLDSAIVGSGKQLSDYWQTKLTSFNGPIPVDTLGWKQPTPPYEW
jgi:hypothetical protein